MSFPLFPQLPSELRLAIWKCAASACESRIIRIRYARLLRYPCSRVQSDAPIYPDPSDENEQTQTTPFFGKTPYNTESWAGPISAFGFRSTCPPPALLLVNKESFRVASERYEQALGTQHGSPATWFDFEHDSLYIDWNESTVRQSSRIYSPAKTNCFIAEDLERIQHLVLDGDLEPFGPGIPQDHAEKNVAAYMKIFPNIKSLTINVMKLSWEDEQSHVLHARDLPPVELVNDYDGFGDVLCGYVSDLLWTLHKIVHEAHTLSSYWKMTWTLKVCSTTGRECTTPVLS